MTYSTVTQTIIQSTTPDEYRGRVMGLFMINNGLTPLGTLIFGSIAEAFGVSTAIIIAGIGGMATVTFILLRFPVIRSYRSGLATEAVILEPATRDISAERRQPATQPTK
jgi:hypothetical protein